MSVRVRVTETIEFPAAAVWRILGGFDGLPAISPSTVSSKLLDNGRVRMLANRDGSILWERLLHFDEAKRTLSYEIFDAKGAERLAYGAGYRGIVRVRQLGKGNRSLFEYKAEFEPRKGVSEREAKKAVQEFIADCAAGVRRVLRLGNSVEPNHSGTPCDRLRSKSTRPVKRAPSVRAGSFGVIRVTK